MIHLVLDNIRSAFNVGSIIRSANAVQDVCIYLCGITPSIDNPKVQKTALGGEVGLTITQHADATEITKLLISKSLPVYSLEITNKSIDYREIEFPKDLVLVVGNEKRGVDQRILEISTKQVHLPMNGNKKSLNVAIATSIMLFEITK